MFSISLRTDVIPRKRKVMQNLGGQIRCIMANVEVAFARDELCLQTRIGGEIFSSKGPGPDWGIRGIFAFGIRNPGNFFFCNPESWNPEYSSNKKFTLKSWIHMQAPLTKNLRSRIHGVESKKPKLSWIPLHGPRPVADPGEGPGGPAPLIFRPPTYLRVWMTGASLLWRSLSASGDFSSQKSVLNLVNFEMFNSL